MREIRSEIEIEASAETAWNILTDFAAYPEWNPFIIKVEGELEAGQHIAVTMRAPGHRASSLRPKLLSVEPGSGFRWLGHVGVPGVFDGEHSHEIEPLGSHRSRYTQSERFRGALVALLGGIVRDAERGFSEMNAALKERAEAVERTRSGQPDSAGIR